MIECVLRTYLLTCSGQLNLLPSAGREMSSSLRATGGRPSVADWSGGMSASCNRGSNCSLKRAMDGRIVCCSIISSCQSAATSEIVKALLVASLTHVRGAIASTRPLPLPLEAGGPSYHAAANNVAHRLLYVCTNAMS